MGTRAPPGTPGEASPAARPNHAWHQQLKNVNSGLCLDLQWNNSANGTPIWLWPCNGIDTVESNGAQLWMLP